MVIKRQYFIEIKLYNMAPSVTETVTVQAPAATLPVKMEDGHNKENFIGYTCEMEREINGTAKLPPASYPHYLPVWDNETERYPSAILY